MFVRINKTPNSPRKSIQICENYREGKKVRQRIIHYVGIAYDETEEEKLKDYAKTLITKIKIDRAKEAGQQSLFPLTEEEVKTTLESKKRGPKKRKKIEDILPVEQVSLKDIAEESRQIEGVHEVVGALFDEMYHGVIQSKKVMKILKHVVLARLVYPCSKRQTQQYLEKQWNQPSSLDAIYRMMDQIFPRIDAIKQRTFKTTQTLFPNQMDLLLFDVTTLYFESIKTDDLRQFGYSKDCRFNTTQVVLALATNQDGLPVGYELFEGNRAEVSTLILSIEHWKKLFKIGSVCFVGDRAMMSRNNIALLEKNGFYYIIAAKLKKLNEDLKCKLLDEGYYRPTISGQSLSWIGEFKHEKGRLIVSYKKQRALKDEKDRRKVLEKIEKMIGKGGSPNRLITNAGVKQFIKKDPKAQVSIDQEKIEQAKQWDGLHGVITNLKEESAEDIIGRYGRLWVIEESFRINKHTLKMRPIFHWKPERIQAHIAICYMAFSILRQLQYQVNLTQKISINEILQTLLSVQSSIYIHKKTHDRYRVPGYFSHKAGKIYKTFRLKRSLDAEIYLKT